MRYIIIASSNNSFCLNDLYAGRNTDSPNGAVSDMESFKVNLTISWAGTNSAPSCCMLVGTYPEFGDFASLKFSRICHPNTFVASC